MTELEKREPGNSNKVIDLEVLANVIEAFRKLDQDERQRLLQTVDTFFGITSAPGNRNSKKMGAVEEASNARGPSFSADRSISPKEFLWEKKPQTAVQRVACLAYYLTHYRDTPQFKTLDISKLNTEAAQVKFSNPALAVNDATKTGYLVPATKGNKQLSVAGERFVEALPDRDAAQAAMASARPWRRNRSPLSRVSRGLR
jgi:hypothetical protein